MAGSCGTNPPSPDECLAPRDGTPIGLLRPETAVFQVAIFSVTSKCRGWNGHAAQIKKLLASMKQSQTSTGQASALTLILQISFAGIFS